MRYILSKNKLSHIQPTHGSSRMFVVVSLSCLLAISTGYITTCTLPGQHVVTLSTTTTKESLSLLPTQYSDTHITSNAIISNPVLAEAYAQGSAQTSQLANVIQTNTPANTSQTQTTQRENGTWLWTPLTTMTTSYMDSVLSKAKANSVNVIYLSVDTYLDAYSLTNITEKASAEKKFSSTLATFISKAHAKGIAVDAEAGWRNWAEDGNTYKAFAILNFVIQFNATHTDKLRGFQYDVEPYMLTRYKTDQTGVLTNFLTLIRQSVTYLNNTDIQLTVTIPDFYDDVSRDTAPFTYDGEIGYAYTHLLHILEKRPGSAVIIMAYRNFATGNDGSIDVSKPEIDEAETDAPHTRIIVAQETGDVEPPYITFNNTSKKYYDTQIGYIKTAFNTRSSFGGIATHYVNAFIALK